MHDYYYCILTGASLLQHKDKVPAKESGGNIRKYLGLVIKLCSTFLERCGKLELRNLVHTSRADTLLQDNEFLSISILLYDIFAIFSIYKILKNSRCGAVHFFLVYPCIKFLCRSHY